MWIPGGGLSVLRGEYGWSKKERRNY